MYVEFNKLKRLEMRKFLIILILIYSCDSDTLPKPNGYLNLSYPQKTYQNFTLEKPYQFEISNQSVVVNQPNEWLKITYPKLKASLDITYRPIKNNLQEILIEAEKLVFKHTIKADEILTKDYKNEGQKVFGSLYSINGNAASNLQFHVTDSLNHFLKGSLYFYAKPNYDSILPAVAYIRDDVLHIMETLKWKN